MFSVQSISHSFGSCPVLQEVSFDLEEGSLTGLIGPSAGGKSVLLKILGGVLEPSSGQVELPESSLEERNLMFQEGALFDSLTVFDNIAFPLVRGNVPSAGLCRATLEDVHSKVEDILRHVGLCKAAFKMPGQLSGGMRRRVSLARALVSRPKYVFLDDPTSGLDPVASSVIMELIRNIHAEYRPTMLIVSHDLRRLLPMIESVIYLDQGQVTFRGTREQLVARAPEQVRTFVACRFDIEGNGKEAALEPDGLRAEDSE